MDQGHEGLLHAEFYPLLFQCRQDHDHLEQDEQWKRSPLCRNLVTSIANSEKTFDKFTIDFKSTFYPFNTKVTAHNKLLMLRQTSFKEKNGETNNRFQQYITDFQNLSMKSGMKEELSLISQFSLGLDHKITSMILSMSPIPTTVKGWIDQAKIFHTQKICILSLRQG